MTTIFTCKIHNIRFDIWYGISKRKFVSLYFFNLFDFCFCYLTLASYWSEFISAINFAIAFSVSSSFFLNFSISINCSVSLLNNLPVAAVIVGVLAVLWADWGAIICCCGCCWWCCFSDDDKLVAAVAADKLALYRSLPLVLCSGCSRLDPKNLVLVLIWMGFLRYNINKYNT